MVRPAAGISLRSDRDARGIQRRGKTERERQPALRQLRFPLDPRKGYAGKQVPVSLAKVAQKFTGVWLTFSLTNID